MQHDEVVKTSQLNPTASQRFRAFSAAKCAWKHAASAGKELSELHKPLDW